MRRATKKIRLDANHLQIVSDLEKQGIEVVTILEPLDVLLRDHDGYIALCEIKIEGNDGMFQRSQIKFLSSTKCPAFVARNAPEALHKLRTRESIGQKAKDALAQLLIKSDAEKFRPGPIHRILEG